MLRPLVAGALRARFAVLALACALVVWGAWSALHAELDVFPDFVPPQVVVQTEAPGLAPEQVERLVTRPLESAINGAGSLESIRSQSIQGLSIITAVFRDGTDVFRARQLLGELLSAAASELPAGVHAPKMTPLTSATMDLLKIGLVSDTLSPMELRDFAQWTLRPRLLAVPGVATVSMFGGEVRELQIQVEPERLAALGFSIQDVLEAARASTGVRGAGFVENTNQRVVVQTEGQSLTAQSLAKVVLARREHRSILIGDVANVVDAAQARFGDALIQGRPGVLMTMLSQYGANTYDTTHAVEEALDELKPAIAARGITLYPRLHRPATFIENSLVNLRDSLLIGAVLVAVVLFLFLFNLRTAFISLTAIPLSLTVAFLVMRQFGATLNTITLGGLAIALGEVVDDAIIDVENIHRRLKQNRALAHPRPVFDVVLDASLEVRHAVVYATFVVVLVFVPVLTLSGLQGRLFAPLAVAYILAILASLAVALIVTPALSLVLLGRGRGPEREFAPLTWARSAYQTVLGIVAKHAAIVIIGVVLLCAATLAMIPLFGGEFLPDFREGHFVLHASAVPGTSLDEMRRLGERISKELVANSHIATVEQQIGRAELGEDPWGPHRSEFHVELKPLEPAVEAGVAEEIREVLASFPGIEYEVLTFLGDRIGETISGEASAVVVSIFGDELSQIEAQSVEVEHVLTSVPGAVDVQRGALPGAPRIEVHLDPLRMAQHGFRPVDVLESVQTAYQGATVAETFEETKVRDVVVILAPDVRRDPERIGELRLRNADGQSVPLSQIADIVQGTGPFVLLHEGGQRRLTVTCNVEGRDVASFVAEARERIAGSIPPSKSTYITFGGEAQAQSAARNELLLHSSLAGVGILLLLGLVFREPRNLALVLVNLPFALVGGVIAAYFAGGSLSIGSLVGFVTLLGITTRNSIMLVSHYEHLVSREGYAWNFATALRGASERFVPITMTALVAGLGLLPLAVESGKAGREIEGPMAAVILGGLVTSTALNLLVLPTLALRFGRFGARAEPA